MAIPKIEGSQRDFSAGELDVSMKRSDDNPIMKAGARQMSNWRIRNSKSVKNRPGRSALFITNGRVEEITMSPGNTFKIAFGHNTIKVFDSNGAQVFTQGGMPWGVTTLQQIVWDVYKLSIYITFPGNVPQVLSWDSVSTWSIADYAETSFGNQKRTFFYRISPPGVTMALSALSGAGVTATFSSAILVAGHVGTRMRYAGRQLLITAVNVDGIHATVTIEEVMPQACTATFATAPSTAFNVGDVVIGQNTGAKGIVTALAGFDATVQMIPTASNITLYFNGLGEFIAGPAGGLQMTALVGGLVPQAITFWDDEVMNSYRGWPTGVFVDQNRLGLCNFPAVPGGIGWSAIGSPTDLYVAAIGDNAIFEIAPGKSRVLYVVPGAEGSEFVFCDNGAYYIPISVTNPLIPGSVAFNLLSKDGCAAVQPRIVQDVILWINAGLTSVLAIVATGAYNRPYEPRNISELHAHLFSGPIAIAAPSTTAQFEERYLYVLNTDGTVIVGKYGLESGQIKGVVGWLPWSGVGTVKWVSAFGSDVIFSTAYAPNGIGVVNVIEKLDDTQYLDAAVSVNAGPTALQQTQPAGTNFGNMIGDGGLAAAFNGTRIQAKAASASLAAADGYVGRHFTTPQVIGQALVWPSSDSGFTIGGTGNITIELRAKATLPANSSDGTLLARAILTADQTTGPVVLNPAYDTATYPYAFVHIAQSGATSVICAQFLPQSGALWWLAGGTVDLMDNLTRMMGTYTIDAGGNIIPQNNAGENLSSTQLVAGQPWTAILEPFVPDAAPGQSVGQRMFRRRVSRMAVYVINSTGFLFARLFSGPITPTSPALSAIMNTRRVTTWNQGDDPTLAPPLREEVQRWRPLGRSFDPRVAIIKDTPGPLEIPEIGFESTI